MLGTPAPDGGRFVFIDGTRSPTRGALYPLRRWIVKASATCCLFPALLLGCGKSESSAALAYRAQDFYDVSRELSPALTNDGKAVRACFEMPRLNGRYGTGQLGTDAELPTRTMCGREGSWRFIRVEPESGNVTLRWAAHAAVQVAIGWGPCTGAPQYCPTGPSINLSDWPKQTPLWIAWSTDPREIGAAEDKDDESSESEPDETQNSDDDSTSESSQTEPDLPEIPQRIEFWVDVEALGHADASCGDQACLPPARCVEDPDGDRCRVRSGETCASSARISLQGSPALLEVAAGTTAWGNDLPSLCGSEPRSDRVLRLGLDFPSEFWTQFEGEDLRLELELLGAPDWRLALVDGPCTELSLASVSCADPENAVLRWPPSEDDDLRSRFLRQSEPYVVLEGPIGEHLPPDARLLARVIDGVEGRALFSAGPTKTSSVWGGTGSRSVDEPVGAQLFPLQSSNSISR